MSVLVHSIFAESDFSMDDQLSIISEVGISRDRHDVYTVIQPSTNLNN